MYTLKKGKKYTISAAVPDKYQKGVLTFARSGLGGKDIFIIEPERNSDYLFSCPDYCDMTVYRNGIERKVVSPVATEEGKRLYALKANTEYTVCISTKTNVIIGYTLTVTQDNWVYAPEGGRRVSEEVQLDRYPHDVFITPQLLVASTIGNLPGVDFNDITTHRIYSESELRTVLAVILRDQHLEDIFTADIIKTGLMEAGGFVLNVIGALSSNPIIIISGFGLSAVGFAIFSNSISQRYENRQLMFAINDGNFSIVCSIDLGGNKKWKAWVNPLYINKYYDGFRGTVTSSLSATDVWEYCEWQAI